MERAKDQFPLSKIQYLVLSKERHEDGQSHFHAFIQFTKKIDDRNAQSTFSLFDKGFHILSNIRYPKKAADYVKKDGEFLEHGDDSDLADPNKKEAISNVILKIAKGQETFIQAIEDHPTIISNLKRYRENVQLY